jgi:hypothetical protein
MRYLYLLIFSFSIFAQGIHQFPSPCDCCFKYVSYVDSIPTFFGDTSDAETTDTVCYNGFTWTYGTIPGVNTLLKTNSGWPIDSIQSDQATWLNACDKEVKAPFVTIRDSSGTCVIDTTIDASDYTVADTIFIRFVDLTCLAKDSLVIYANDGKWYPVCTITPDIDKWEANDGGCSGTKYRTLLYICEPEDTIYSDSNVISLTPVEE